MHFPKRSDRLKIIHNRKVSREIYNTKIPQYTELYYLSRQAELNKQLTIANCQKREKI